jgi:hypothetical protein
VSVAWPRDRANERDGVEDRKKQNQKM